MSGKIHQPHDKLFKKALSNLQVITDLIKSYLPKELLNKTDLNTLEMLSSRFISEQYKLSEADVLYKVQIANKPAYLYLLCEHQSDVDPMMPYRLLKYTMHIIDNHLQQQAKQCRKNGQEYRPELPLVYPMVVYSGESEWLVSRDIFSLFGEQAELAKTYFFGQFDLIDIHRISDDDMHRRFWFGVVEFALKYQKAKDLSKFLHELLQWLGEIEALDCTGFSDSVIEYAINGLGDKEINVLYDEIDLIASKKLRGKVMSFAQMLEDRGIEKGIQKGMQQGMEKGVEKTRREFVLRLLDAGASRLVIKLASQYTDEEIDALLAEQSEI